MDAQVRAVGTALTEWFQARAAREQRLLLGGGALLVAMLVYNVLWEPAWEGAAAIRASLPQLQGQLLDVESQADQARRLKGAAAMATPSGVALRDALGASLAQTGIVEPQLTVVGKAVQVDVKAVPFGAWMTWLDSVRSTSHVRVVNVHASADAQVGRATVSATLEPASGS